MKIFSVHGSCALFFICIVLFTSGCTHSVQLNALTRDDTIAKAEYSLYLYSSGTGETLRTVFAKAPGTSVEVVPYSKQIETTRGSFQNALSFMEEKKGLRKILIQKIIYRETLAGYLLTYDVYSPFRQAESITVDIFERGGALYFAVTEQVQTAD